MMRCSALVALTMFGCVSARKVAPLRDGAANDTVWQECSVRGDPFIRHLDCPKRSLTASVMIGKRPYSERESMLREYEARVKDAFEEHGDGFRIAPNGFVVAGVARPGYRMTHPSGAEELYLLFPAETGTRTVLCRIGGERLKAGVTIEDACGPLLEKLAVEAPPLLPRAY